MTKDKSHSRKGMPLIDQRKTSSTDYKNSGICQIQMHKKDDRCGKNQIKNITNNPDIYKKQTLKELTEEINTSLIPEIIKARKKPGNKDRGIPNDSNKRDGKLFGGLS